MSSAIELAMMNGHAWASTCQRRMASGAATTTPTAVATASVAWLSRAPAISMFQSAWMTAAARTMASVVSATGGAWSRGLGRRGGRRLRDDLFDALESALQVHLRV